MTIGIVCFGDDPVRAAVRAVLGAELLGRGAIGGFTVLALLDADGIFRHTSVQRGGVSGLDIQPQWHEATIAAIISSGPDRPEPLIQFLPGRDHIGLVTGHRLPNTVGVDARPLNMMALDLLQTGQHPQSAVDSVLDGEPEADAGLIAIDMTGAIGMRNATRAARRPDLGQASRAEAGRSYALLHNSIYANMSDCMALASTLGELSWEALGGGPAACEFLRLTTPLALTRAAQDRVTINAEGQILSIETANAALLSGQHATRSVVYGAPAIYRGGHLAGYAATELFARLEDGVAYPLPRVADHTMLMRKN